MSTRILTLLTCGLLAAVGATQCFAADDGSAQALHKKHCVACHGTEVYTRETRTVESFPALKTQVRRCEMALELDWTDEKISAVSQYLNNRFYHFKP